MGSTATRLVLLLLLWHVNAASATMQCDTGIIVACTLGTFGGCALLLGVPLLVRAVRSRRRRRAMFEGNPIIRSYSKLSRGTDNTAFVADGETTATCHHDGISAHSVAKQATWTKQTKNSKGSNEPMRATQKAALDDLASTDQPVHSRLVAVDLISKDIIGLGFGIQGTYSDGIYISEVHDRGPAKGTGLVEVGDRIVSLTVSTENMAYEDALALLSYATPYRVTVQLLKHSNGGITTAAAGSRDSRLLRKKDRDSVAATVYRGSSGAGLHTLRHPAFFGRSQSVDDSLVNGSLLRPVRSATRLSSLGPMGSPQSKTIVPPPKPKRSMDLSSGGSGSGTSGSSVVGLTAVQASRPMQLQPPPLAPVTELTSTAQLHVAADSDARHSMPTEEPLSTTTIKPLYLSAGRLSSVTDSPTTMTSESSLLEDINRVLAHERPDPVALLGRQGSPASDLDAFHPDESVYGEDEVPDGLFDWEVGTGVNSKDVRSAPDYVRVQGSPPPPYAAAGTSKLQPAATDAASATGDVQPPAAAAVAHFGQSRNENRPRGRQPESFPEVCMFLAAAKEEPDSTDDASIRMSNGPPSITGDDAYEHDARTSTPIRSYSAEQLTSGSGASPEPSGDATSELSDATEEQPIDHALPSSGGLLWQPSSWSALLDNSTGDQDASPVDRPSSALSSAISSEGRAREILASDSHQPGHNGFMIVAVQREAVKLSQVIKPGESNSDKESLPPPLPAEWSGNEEANGFHWTPDDCHFATRRISSATTMSGESDAKGSDNSGDATRSRASEDEVTPQPLRKFGNFANLSNDELDASDSGQFRSHMADRESVSSECSTPTHSEHADDSRTTFTYSEVDENLNQESKLVPGQVGRQVTHPVEVGGKPRRDVEEARARFFSELLQRSTH